MAILLDTKGHLISSTSDEELHLFARRLGLKREWFQDTGKNFHYDLTTARMKAKALMLGAESISPKDLVSMLRKRRVK